MALKVNRKVICLCVCLVLILLSGCAAKTSCVPKGYDILQHRTFLVDKQSYISLDNFCGAYSFEWEWDSVSRHLFCANSRLTVSLLCGSSMALVNGNVEYLNNPTIIERNNIAIPAELVKLIDDFYLSVPRQKDKLRMKTIVIDPGHGGKDPGAVGISGLKEKDVVLDIALQLKKLLQAKGVRIVMTRERDEFISLWKRTHIANNSVADFFVSIHANASRSKWSKGFEVYCLSNTVDDEARAIVAAENNALQFEESTIDVHNVNLDATLWDLCLSENRAQSLQMADILCAKAVEELEAKSRGVKTAHFYVLKGVRIPAVLVEVGFVSNKSEEKNLKSLYYRKQVASALASGIFQYKNAFESTNGFTD